MERKINTLIHDMICETCKYLPLRKNEKALLSHVVLVHSVKKNKLVLLAVIQYTSLRLESILFIFFNSVDES